MEIDDTSLSDYEKAVRERWGNPTVLDSLSNPDVPDEEEVTPDEEEVTPDEETPDEEPTEPEPEPEEPPTEPEPTPTDLIDVGGGRHLTRAQLESYLAFEERLRANPRLLEYLKAYNPNPDLEPVTTTVPDEVDLEDPNIRFLYEQNQELQRRLNEVGKGLDVQQQQSLAEKRTQLESLANRAVSSFKQQHNLTDEQVTKVRSIAGRINAIDSYMAGTHPITGDSVTPDILAAMECALTIAYNSSDEFIEQRHESVVRRQLDNKERKKKLAKVGASSASAPRTPPPAANKQELRTQFVEEVRGLMFGGSES